MPFATGYLVLDQRHSEGEPRERVKKALQQMGFELYEVGKPTLLVYYVEAGSVKELEDRIKAAEKVEGVLKAFVVFSFLGDEQARQWLNKAIEAGELQLDETTLNYLKWILRRLGVEGYEEAGTT